MLWMAEFSNEPEVKERVTLETAVGASTVVQKATIANITPSEVWVAVGDNAAAFLVEGAAVRVILTRPLAGGITAETSVERIVGGSGRMIALRRPETWVSGSRRGNGRVGLAIPAYVHISGDSVVSARTTNLSVGGFHCVTDLSISVGHQMPVSLMFTPTESFDCLAQVVRLSDDPDDPWHRRLIVAFRFLNLSADDEVRIAEALAALGGETDAGEVPAAWHSARGQVVSPGSRSRADFRTSRSRCSSAGLGQDCSQIGQVVPIVSRRLGVEEALVIAAVEPAARGYDGEIAAERTREGGKAVPQLVHRQRPPGRVDLGVDDLAATRLPVGVGAFLGRARLVDCKLGRDRECDFMPREQVCHQLSAGPAVCGPDRDGQLFVGQVSESFEWTPRVALLSEEFECVEVHPEMVRGRCGPRVRLARPAPLFALGRVVVEQHRWLECVG
jgi:hypothetical protein